MKSQQFKLAIIFSVMLTLLGVNLAMAQGGSPTVVSYQGYVTVSATAYNGTGYFKFAVVNAAGTTSYWSNNGTSTNGGAPTNAVALTVSGGLFNVLLGDTTITNMTQPLTATVFSATDRYLRVWFSTTSGGTFTQLSPDRAFAAAPYALQADTLDGLQASAFQQHYANAIVVAKSGGDYTTISAALASITDNSATNRYLIWVAPGTYTEQVTMKQYVDIEGAGELATKITNTGNGSGYTGTVVGANNAELRFLTVENTGGGSVYATAISNSSASPRFTHITATASGGSNNVGVYNTSASSPTMTNVTVTASGGSSNVGVYNTSASSPTMTNVTVTASGGSLINTGVANDSSSPTMTNVTVTASGGNASYGMYNNTSSSPVMTNVTATASGGTYSYGVYNNSSSPTMTNVKATASGGTTNYGVYNSSSSPTMMDVTATASGGTANYGVYNYTSSSPKMMDVTTTASGGLVTYGVYNESSSSPTMTNVTATASGGTLNNLGVCNSNSSPTMTNVTVTASGGTTSRGVYNDSSSPTIQNSTIRATNGTNNYGIYNSATSNTYTVNVNNSQILGSTNTILNDTEFTTRVGASKLEGGAVMGGGTLVCVFSYNASYVALNATCQ